VDDYLSENEKWEAVKAWLRENGLSIVAGIAVGAAGLGGWKWWQAREGRLALEASAKYELVLEAFARADQTRGKSLIAELERDYASSPYVDQAHLLAASSAVSSGQLDEAVANLSKVVDSSNDRELGLIARLRLARVQVAQNKLDDALKSLSPEEPGAFAARFHEVRGDVYFEKGDKANALKEYRAARERNTLAAAGGGSQVLDLKINDLVADAGPPAQPATKAN
jgi:predicted negative regulator of RcsB-dependent stress response